MEKWKRKLEIVNRCKICGVAEENSYHAVMSCTKARAPRNEMRLSWELPSEDQLQYTGPDWLLVLLNAIPKVMKKRILLIMWRSWHLRNDIIHEKGKATIADSVSFLRNYECTLLPARQQATDTKGKKAMFDLEEIRTSRRTT